MHPGSFQTDMCPSGISDQAFVHSGAKLLNKASPVKAEALSFAVKVRDKALSATNVPLKKAAAHLIGCPDLSRWTPEPGRAPLVALWAAMSDWMKARVAWIRSKDGFACMSVIGWNVPAGLVRTRFAERIPCVARKPTYEALYV